MYSFSSKVGLERINGLHAIRFEEAFFRLIKRHNQIFELTYIFRQRYWIITLAHFVSASMVIGFSIFLLMTVGANGLGTLLYIGYTVAALSQLFIYCYGGTFVAESVSLVILFASNIIFIFFIYRVYNLPRLWATVHGIYAHPRNVVMFISLSCAPSVLSPWLYPSFLPLWSPLLLYVAYYLVIFRYYFRIYFQILQTSGSIIALAKSFQ